MDEEKVEASPKQHDQEENDDAVAPAGPLQPVLVRRGASWRYNDIWSHQFRRTNDLLAAPTTPPEDIIEAAWWVRDAQALRLENGMGSLLRRKASPERIRMFQWQTSKTFMNMVLASMVIQCLLNFLENCGDPEGAMQQGSPGTLALESVCLLFPAVDIYWKIQHMTWPKFRSKWWHLVYTSTIVLQIANLAVTAIGLALIPGARFPIERPMRILRPVGLLVRSHKIRTVVVTVGRLFMERDGRMGIIPETLLEIFVFVGVFVGVGLHFYADAYTADDLQETNEFERKAFANPLKAFMRLFVLLSNENYEALVDPTLPCKFRLLYENDKDDDGVQSDDECISKFKEVPHQISIVFFFSFTFLATFIVTNVLFARIVDFYSEFHRQQMEKDRHKQRLALIEAFKLLADNRGHFNFPTWCHLFEQMRHIGLVSEDDWNHALLRFDLLDRDGDDTVDVVDFLFVESCLNLRIFQRQAGLLTGCVASCTKDANSFLSRAQHYFLERVPKWKAFATRLISLHLLTTLIWWKAISPEQQHAVACVSLACSIGCGIEVFGFVFFLSAPLRGLRLFSRGWYRLSPRTEVDVVCATASVIFACCAVFMGPAHPRIYRWLWVPAWLNAVRILRVSDAAAHTISIMMDIGEFAAPLTVGSVCVMHIFAFLGTRFFCNSNQHFSSSFTRAFGSFYLIILGDDWNDLMDATVHDQIEKQGNRGIGVEFSYSLLFMTFYALFHFVLILLFTSIVYHAYAVLSKHLKETNDRICLDVDMEEDRTTVLQPSTGRTHSVSYGTKTKQLIHMRSTRLSRKSSLTKNDIIQLAHGVEDGAEGKHARFSNAPSSNPDEHHEGTRESRLTRKSKGTDGESRKRHRYIIRSAPREKWQLLHQLARVTDDELLKLGNESGVDLLSVKKKKKAFVTRDLDPKEVTNIVTRFAQGAAEHASKAGRSSASEGHNMFKQMFQDAVKKVQEHAAKEKEKKGTLLSPGRQLVDRAKAAGKANSGFFRSPAKSSKKKIEPVLGDDVGGGGGGRGTGGIEEKGDLPRAAAAAAVPTFEATSDLQY
jgi:hypothetical protein